MNSHKIQWLPAAVRRFGRLDPQVQARILRRISSLADDPRPSGVLKLSGSTDLWRIRVGDYRVIYSIVDDILVVTVVEVGHRREVYRSR
ncbi:MAG: type II toxin-antitoxin system RelE/ParE family toxin [Micromonosporaceae bacterium]|nr:type II toxin-antitoxin system RelE/ParE family toxin [Micromonosporaceae bacterium]